MTKFQRTPETLFALIDQDVVALHVERGKCFGMEKVSADVWDMLEHPASIDELCGRLMGHYAVEVEQCRSEVTQLVDQMVEEGLVKAIA